MIVKRTIVRSVPTTSTTRATPGVDPARASVVVSWIVGSVCRGSVIMVSSQILFTWPTRLLDPCSARSSGGGHRRCIEEQRLCDRSFDGRALERLGDQECGFRASAGEQPLGEGGDKDHRHREL